MSRVPTQVPRVKLEPSPRETSNALNHLLGITQFGSLVNAADDAAAAAAGVNVGELYRNGSVVCVRVA